MRAAAWRARSLEAIDATAAPIPLLAIGMVLAAGSLTNRSVQPSALVLAGAGAFLVYLADRAWLASPEDGVNRPGRVQWHARHRWYRWFAAAIAGTVCLAAWGVVDMPLKVTALVLLGAALLHLVPAGGRPGKSHPIAKPLLLGLTWGAGATLVAVLGQRGHPTDTDLGGAAVAGLVLVTTLRAMLVASNVVAVDVHDTKGDSTAGLQSVATLRGPVAAGKLARFLAIGSAVVAVVAVVVTHNALWSVEAVGALGFAVLTGRRPAPGADVLDLWMAWPWLTYLTGLL